MSLKPISDDLVIAKAQAAETTTEFGLVLPGDAIQRPQYATVIAVSDDHTKTQPGDQILIRKHSGTEVSHEGEDYLVLHIHEILAVIK